MILLGGRLTWKMIHNLFDIKISYCVWLAWWNIILDRIFGVRSSLSVENGETSDRKSEWKGNSVIKIVFGNWCHTRMIEKFTSAKYFYTFEIIAKYYCFSCSWLLFWLKSLLRYFSFLGNMIRSQEILGKL